MIKSARFINFQGHKDTLFEFHEGVNYIIGKTDSGKTSFVRGVDFVIHNNNKKNYRRKVKKKIVGDTSVRFDFEEGYVERNKGKVDSYVVKKKGKKAKELKAFGTSVPDYVSAFINMNEVNVQKQLDSSFLLTETAGKVAKHFNKVANLETIDSSLQKVNSMIREANQVIGYKKEDEKEKEEQLSEFDDIDDIEMDLEEVEDIEVKVAKKQKYIRNLKRDISAITVIEEQLDDYGNVLDAEDEVTEVLDLINKQGLIKEEVIQITENITSLDKYISRIEQAEHILEDEDEILSLIDLMDVHEDLENEVIPLVQSVKQYQKVKFAIAANKELLSKMEINFGDNMKVCPLCGSEEKYHKH